MVDVVLRKTGSKDYRKEYALMIRDYSSGIEVDWTTLCYMDYYSAHQIKDETITFWEGDPENKKEVSSLRLDHPALRKAWDQYQLLKNLAKPEKEK
jgi:hypothetical protein